MTATPTSLQGLANALGLDSTGGNAEVLRRLQEAYTTNRVETVNLQSVLRTTHMVIAGLVATTVIAIWSSGRSNTSPQGIIDAGKDSGSILRGQRVSLSTTSSSSSSDSIEKLPSDVKAPTLTDCLGDLATLDNKLTACNRDLQAATTSRNACNNLLAECKNEKGLLLDGSDLLGKEAQRARTLAQQCLGELSLLTNVTLPKFNTDKDAVDGQLKQCNTDKGAVDGQLKQCNTDKNAVEGTLKQCNTDKGAVDGQLKQCNTDKSAVEGTLKQCNTDKESCTKNYNTLRAGIADLVAENKLLDQLANDCAAGWEACENKP